MSKYTDSDSEDDHILLLSKLKKLKFDAPILSGRDQGQATTNDANTDRPVVKKRRLVKVG